MGTGSQFRFQAHATMLKTQVEDMMRSFAVKKYILTGLVLAAGCMIAVQTSVKTQAQTPAPLTKVGIVNLQVAMQNTNEGKAAVADLQKRFIDPRTTELTAKQNDIKDMTDRLQRGGNTMSQTAKDDLQRQIDAKTKSFQRDVEDYNADREEEERKILDDLVVKMRVVIEKYSLDNGFRSDVGLVQSEQRRAVVGQRGRRYPAGGGSLRQSPAGTQVERSG